MHQEIQQLHAYNLFQAMLKLNFLFSKNTSPLFQIALWAFRVPVVASYSLFAYSNCINFKHLCNSLFCQIIGEISDFSNSLEILEPSFFFLSQNHHNSFSNVLFHIFYRYFLLPLPQTFS